MILHIYTDGGSKGNPGPAAIGGVGYLDKKIIFKFRDDIGIATNNDAEYQAVIMAYKKLSMINNPVSTAKRSEQLSKVKKIEFFSDSQLVVNQLNGFYKVKNGRIREYIMQIRILEAEVKIPVIYQHIPREKNQAADDLVNNIKFQSSNIKT